MHDHREKESWEMEDYASSSHPFSPQQGVFLAQHCQEYQTLKENNMQNHSKTIVEENNARASGFTRGDRVKFKNWNDDGTDREFPGVFTVDKIQAGYVYLALGSHHDNGPSPGLGGWDSRRFVKVTEEAVDHPKHYNSDPSGVECIQVTEHRNFCVGNAMKYLWRAGLKGTSDSNKHIEDLKKSVWYINREIERLGKIGS